MTRAVWRIHQQVDPHATIVAPSFAVRLPPSDVAVALRVAAVVGHPVRRYYDVNALSIYPKVLYDGRPGGPEDAMRMLTLVRHGWPGQAYRAQPVVGDRGQLRGDRPGDGCAPICGGDRSPT